MQSPKLSVEFGKPEHHWLPVRLAYDDFKLDVEASAVLGDSVEELAQALSLVTQQADATVNWFLEPLGYRFEFIAKPARQVRFVIYEFVERNQLEAVFELQANYEVIILPFWRALQKLKPADFGNQHWDPLPLKKLHRLKQLVKAHRAAN